MSTSCSGLTSRFTRRSEKRYACALDLLLLTVVVAVLDPCAVPVDLVLLSVLVEESELHRVPLDLGLLVEASDPEAVPLDLVLAVGVGPCDADDPVRRDVELGAVGVAAACQLKPCPSTSGSSSILLHRHRSSPRLLGASFVYGARSRSSRRRATASRSGSTSRFRRRSEKRWSMCRRPPAPDRRRRGT